MQGFSVKELSKITGVAARNIRYYDSAGLFKPSGTAENGYRYYYLEKIEELRLISYLRHAGVPIKEIGQHLKNRNIDEYSEILENQLQKVEEEMMHLTALKQRLSYRIESLDYIRNLPPRNKIVIEKLPPRTILKIEAQINTPLDWEKAMLKLEREEGLPPSLIIGESGFFVDMNTWQTRGDTQFSGLFLFANDPFFKQSDSFSELPGGDWLTLYIKGDHSDASKEYQKMIQYAEDHAIQLGDYGIERTLIDHFISSDPDLYITEIQIPIITG